MELQSHFATGLTRTTQKGEFEENLKTFKDTYSRTVDFPGWQQWENDLKQQVIHATPLSYVVIGSRCTRWKTAGRHLAPLTKHEVSAGYTIL